MTKQELLELLEEYLSVELSVSDNYLYLQILLDEQPICSDMLWLGSLKEREE